jgi:hypothetical protein
MTAIRTLTFQGTVSGGAGKHSEMLIPDLGALPDAPDDWPERLCPGSLNIVIAAYPEGFSEPVGRTRGVYQLDDGAFPPAFVIPGDLMTENKLVHNGGPAPAQVWRARLQVAGRSGIIPCWVLRRFGSNVGKGRGGNVLEIVSADHLREAYDLRDDHGVTLELFEDPAAP